MSLENSEGSTTVDLFRDSMCSRREELPSYQCRELPIRSAKKTQFYVDVQEKCKRRAAREVSELQAEDKRKEVKKLHNGGDITVLRVPKYLKEENIGRIEAYLTEHYMETVYQKLWQKAQNAVFGAD